MRSVKQTDILTGSIPKQLLLFFLPIWFGTLFQQLYNTADTLIVGNFVGTNALAAVGATSSFVNLLVGLFVGLCSGAGVVIAQSWGARDADAVDRQVHTALVLSVVIGALLTVLGLLTAE
ncbi:MAG: MATE family efflux transporter, partial [Subdoligranulum variabile]|nr:MATE family efflux transporter [Subdoligranulum variabile]